MSALRAFWRSAVRTPGRLANLLPKSLRPKSLRSRSARKELGAIDLLVLGRLRASALFDADEYLISRPDVAKAGVDPYVHFVQHGFDEAQTKIRSQTIHRALGQAAKDHETKAAAYLADFDAAQTSDRGLRFAKRQSIAIVLHSQANYYMHPVAQALRHAITAAGASCELIDENDVGLRSVDCPIIIAPHEFFALTIPEFAKTKPFMQRCVMYNTEQMPSPWFQIALGYMHFAKAVIDLNFQTAQVFGKHYPAAHVLPPFDAAQIQVAAGQVDPSHPLFKWMPREQVSIAGEVLALRDRPLDVFFTGFKTKERNRVFIGHADYFARKNAFIAYTQLSGKTVPYQAKTAAMFANNIAIARHSKVVINPHRYPVGYFEWERMIAQGFGCGATVVATQTLPSPFFKAGVHYFESISRNLDKVVQHILETDEGLAAAQEAADRAREVVSAQLTGVRVGNYMLNFLSDVHEGR